MILSCVVCVRKMSQENQDLKRLVYTSHEKEFLKELVLKYKSIVENKRTDGATLQQKQKAWNEIENEYNAVPDHNKVSIIFFNSDVLFLIFLHY